MGSKEALSFFFFLKGKGKLCVYSCTCNPARKHRLEVTQISGNEESFLCRENEESCIHAMGSKDLLDRLEVTAQPRMYNN